MQNLGGTQSSAVIRSAEGSLACKDSILTLVLSGLKHVLKTFRTLGNVCLGDNLKSEGMRRVRALE